MKPVRVLSLVTVLPLILLAMPLATEAQSRWAEGNYDRLPDLAAELVRLKVDVLVTAGTKAVLGAHRATTTIPIVMASSGDIVALASISTVRAVTEA
jgi:ABC-type uncharacterized transport system substrate-binding protein